MLFVVNSTRLPRIYAPVPGDPSLTMGEAASAPARQVRLTIDRMRSSDRKRLSHQVWACLLRHVSLRNTMVTLPPHLWTHVVGSRWSPCANVLSGKQTDCTTTWPENLQAIMKISSMPGRPPARHQRPSRSCQQSLGQPRNPGIETDALRSSSTVADVALACRRSWPPR